MTNSRDDSNSSSPDSPKSCPCQTLESLNPTALNPLKVYCSKCIRRILAPQIERHAAALEERNRSRSLCASRFSEMRSNVQDNETEVSSSSTRAYTPTPAMYKIAQFRDSFCQLQKRLDKLKRGCVSLSVSLASKNISNEERSLNLGVQKNRIIMARQELLRLSNSVLISAPSASIPCNSEGTRNLDKSHDQNHPGCSLNDALHNRVQEVKYKRFQLALQAFEMHRMDVGQEYNNLALSDFLDESEDPTSNKGDILQTSQLKRRIRDKVLSGIGKIGGLPLPHRGALYKVLRSDVLASSLRLVASLTQLLASCLGILLPRPILLRPIISDNLNYYVSNMTSLDLTTTRVKHQTRDIITNVTSKRDWHKLQKKREVNGIMVPNHTTTMQDLEELGENKTTKDISTPINSISVTISDSSESIVSSDAQQHFHQRAMSTVASTSTNSLLSLMGSSSNMLSRAFDKMKGQHHHQLNSRNSSSDKTSINTIKDVSRISMDDLSISARLLHSSCAIICDNTIGHLSSISIKKQQQKKKKDNGLSRSAAMHYELQPPHYSSNANTTGVIDREVLNQQEENFTMALHLLQNNVIALSVQSGVPVSALWPAEAILLNLHSLKLYCMEQTLT